MNIDKMSLEEQIEYHAHMLAVLGKKLGYTKITDKTKWREPIMAGKLSHKAFEKISAGKNSEKYGADAFVKDGVMAEYKSQALEEKQLKNLLQKIKSKKTGNRYTPLSIVGVYNGAYSHEAIDAYDKHEHYFGVFYEEKCLLIIKPDHGFLINTLREEVDRRAKENKNISTNLNSVKINLGDTHLYEVVYRNEEWFKLNA